MRVDGACPRRIRAAPLPVRRRRAPRGYPTPRLPRRVRAAASRTTTPPRARSPRDARDTDPGAPGASIETRGEDSESPSRSRDRASRGYPSRVRIAPTRLRARGVSRRRLRPRGRARSVRRRRRRRAREAVVATPPPPPPPRTHPSWPPPPRCDARRAPDDRRDPNWAETTRLGTSARPWRVPPGGALGENRAALDAVADAAMAYAVAASSRRFPKDAGRGRTGARGRARRGASAGAGANGAPPPLPPSRRSAAPAARPCRLREEFSRLRRRERGFRRRHAAPAIEVEPFSLVRALPGNAHDVVVGSRVRVGVVIRVVLVARLILRIRETQTVLAPVTHAEGPDASGFVVRLERGVAGRLESSSERDGILVRGRVDASKDDGGGTIESGTPGGFRSAHLGAMVHGNLPGGNIDDGVQIEGRAGGEEVGGAVPRHLADALATDGETATAPSGVAAHEPPRGARRRRGAAAKRGKREGCQRLEVRVEGAKRGDRRGR